MIIIPLYIFLFVYFALIFVSLIYVIFNFYHLFRFGSLETMTVFASFLFLAILIIIVFCSYQEIIKINWQNPIVVIHIPEFIYKIVPQGEIEMPWGLGNINLSNQLP